MRRYELGDKALDLAISLESILTDGAGENTFKIGLRTALLTAGDRQARLRARAVFGALYQVRSAVAHDGRAPDDVTVSGFGREKSADVITEALTLSAAILRRLMQEKAIPEWRSFELGS